MHKPPTLRNFVVITAYMEIKEIIRNARERMAVEALTPMQHKMAGLGKTESAVLTAPTGSVV
jgi:hypothetical protein